MVAMRYLLQILPCRTCIDRPISSFCEVFRDYKLTLVHQSSSSSSSSVCAERLGLLGINILVILHLGYYVTTKDFYCFGSCWEINVQVHSGLFIVLMLLVIYQDKERSIIRTDIVCVQSNK